MFVHRTFLPAPLKPRVLAALPGPYPHTPGHVTSGRRWGPGKEARVRFGKGKLWPSICEGLTSPPPHPGALCDQPKEG